MRQKPPNRNEAGTMTWMLTASGGVVNLHHLAPDTLHLHDIAHHLARTDRYNGACKRPYSVAEHSLLVCDILATEFGERDPTVLLAALLHDAHEAYTGDLASPMKQIIGDAWAIEEHRIAYAVRRRFGVAEAYASAANHIHSADMMALSTERLQLLPPSGPVWPCTLSHPPVKWINLDDQAQFDWEDWRDGFMDRFDELNFAIELERQERG